METHKTVYWDEEKQLFYWISWFDTGNSEIPTRNYITAKLVPPTPRYSTITEEQ